MHRSASQLALASAVDATDDATAWLIGEVVSGQGQAVAAPASSMCPMTNVIELVFAQEL